MNTQELNLALINKGIELMDRANKVKPIDCKGVETMQYKLLCASISVYNNALKDQGLEHATTSIHRYGSDALIICPGKVNVLHPEAYEKVFRAVYVNNTEQVISNTNNGKRCGVCGQLLTEIRGRFPSDPERKVCACCATERLESMLEQEEMNKCKAAKSNE